MATWTAFTTLADKARAEALAEALDALEPEPAGVGVFEVEDGSGTWEVGGYFAAPPDAVGLALLAAVHGSAEFTVSELPETDWVAHVRRELSPVAAGRFLVHGAHDAGAVPEGRIGLLIEASMAFGTGHHATTRGCLMALDDLADTGFRPRRVADIGCGTAVLAMAAARLWPVPVVASDIDPVAVEVARANLAANGLDDRFQTCVAAGFGDAALAGPFDLVFANILKGPLLDLADDMAAATVPGSVLILSGILAEQADEIVAHYGARGFKSARRSDIVDWSTVTLTRNHPII